MQEELMIFEYWRNGRGSEFRRLHKPSCLLLPAIRLRNENWLEDCSAAEALVLLAGTPGASKCSQCLPEEL